MLRAMYNVLDSLCTLKWRQKSDFLVCNFTPGKYCIHKTKTEDIKMPGAGLRSRLDIFIEQNPEPLMTQSTKWCKKKKKGCS